MRCDAARVRALLQLGADPNTRALPPSGCARFLFWRASRRDPMIRRSALMIAAECDFPALLDALLDHGARIDEVVEYGWSAVSWAIEHRKSQALQHLLERGANV